jgi:hypothetical protein
MLTSPPASSATPERSRIFDITPRRGLSIAAEAEERDPNEIISADDVLKRAEAMDALASEAEDPMAALLAADEEESSAPAAPPVPDDAARALAELMASRDDEPSSGGDDDDYDPFAALDDFGDQKEA